MSALNRYEFNTEQRDTHITPGRAYTLEWGVSKSVCKDADLGVVGYYQQQVTADSGTAAASRDRVAAIGPEVSVTFPKPMLFRLAPLQLRIHGREPRARPHRRADADETVLGHPQKFRPSMAGCNRPIDIDTPQRRAQAFFGFSVDWRDLAVEGFAPGAAGLLEHHEFGRARMRQR